MVRGGTAPAPAVDEINAGLQDPAYVVTESRERHLRLGSVWEISVRHDIQVGRGVDARVEVLRQHAAVDKEGALQL